MTEIALNLPESTILYYPDFLAPHEADALFHTLQNDVPWRQDQVHLFGKWHNQPRLTALMATNQRSYSYSGLEMHPIPMSEEVLSLKKRVEEIGGVRFTTCLLNRYRHGQDSNGWHADDEKELGQNPVIASVSLGATRKFHFRNKRDKTLKHRMELDHGSLLVMAGATQHHWQHQVPKTKQEVGERINLTFRYIQ